MSGAAEEIVRAAAAQLRERYVFPDRGAAMAEALLSRVDEFAGLDTAALCEALTTAAREVCPDRHLRVVWHEEPKPRYEGDGWADPARLASHWAGARLDNHGVYRVERLAGNVGYLDLRSIEEAEQTALTIAAAMALLAHTGALLLDLRHNNGGAPSGVAFLCSYFFGPTPVHVNDVYDRATDSVHQYWTLPQLPGPRYLDRDVFVLTSAKTFSGAEEIAYNLQQQRRATIVGEVTHGGAHPGGEFWLHPHATIRVPVARSVNPVSGTNWEGVGVTPDVVVSAGEAFDEAYAAALRSVLARLGDSEAEAGLRVEATEALALLTGTGVGRA
jgi:Peptidase family S41